MAKALAHDGAPSAELTRFERYTLRLMHRRDLKTCPFNPRKISAYAKQRLKQRIEQIGLLEPVVWNEPTDYLISGHQRLAILDMLEGHEDYRLHVAVTHLTEEEARGQVVFFNNPAVQGTWDLEQLFELCRDEADLDKMGLEPVDLQFLFGPEQLAAVRLKQPGAPPLADDAPLADFTSPAPGERAPRVQQLAEAKASGMQRMYERDRTDFYVVVVFAQPQDRERFLDRLNLSPVEQYIPAAVLEAALWPER